MKSHDPNHMISRLNSETDRVKIKLNMSSRFMIETIKNSNIFSTFLVTRINHQCLGKLSNTNAINKLPN